MDSPSFVRLRSWLVVNRLAQQVEYSSQSIFSYWNGDRRTCVHRFNASYKTVGGSHGDTSYNVVAYMLCDLADKGLAVKLDFYCIQKIRKVFLCKLDIDYRADDLNNLADIFLRHLHNQSFP